VKESIKYRILNEHKGYEKYGCLKEFYPVLVRAISTFGRTCSGSWILKGMRGSVRITIATDKKLGLTSSSTSNSFTHLQIQCGNRHLKNQEVT
jgi:hypothetical protein